MNKNHIPIIAKTVIMIMIIRIILLIVHQVSNIIVGSALYWILEAITLILPVLIIIYWFRKGDLD